MRFHWYCFENSMVRAHEAWFVQVQAALDAAPCPRGAFLTRTPSPERMLALQQYGSDSDSGSSHSSGDEGGPEAKRRRSRSPPPPAPRVALPAPAALLHAFGACTLAAHATCCAHSL